MHPSSYISSLLVSMLWFCIIFPISMNVWLYFGAKMIIFCIIHKGNRNIFLKQWIILSVSVLSYLTWYMWKAIVGTRGGGGGGGISHSPKCGFLTKKLTYKQKCFILDLLWGCFYLSHMLKSLILHTWQYMKRSNTCLHPYFVYASSHGSAESALCADSPKPSLLVPISHICWLISESKVYILHCFRAKCCFVFFLFFFNNCL